MVCSAHTQHIYTEQVYLDRLNPFDAFIYEQNICTGCGIKCSCALHRLIRVTQPARLLQHVRRAVCFAAVYFLTTSVRPIISTSTGPIFARFTGLVELWLLMISQKVVFFRSLKGLCHGNRSLLALSTELSSGDIRQMAVYEK